jgi:hypothetical protein
VNSEYLKFSQLQARPGIKTEIWAVLSKKRGETLGTIQWYSPWRQYTFYPFSDTIYNRACLTDVAMFITGLMDARKKE